MSDRDPLLHQPFSRAISSLKKALKKQYQAALDERLKRKNRPLSPQPTTTEIEAQPQESTEAFFRREMAGVKPLARGNFVPARPQTECSPPLNDDEAEALAQLADMVEGRTQFDFINSDEYIEGIVQGLDRRLLKKLRQGTFAFQAHIDLHGKTRHEARQIVESFLLESRRRGIRCVLIVHGRGLNSKDQIPVLKERLQVWLAKGRIAASVLAFCSARPTDGGVGAVYVLLRR